MKIAIAGTGYVGLVTGVTLAHVGHEVTCVDVDHQRIELMQRGKSPIYEDGLEQLMVESADNLTYTSDHKVAYKDKDVIFICVGTPEREDGSANLDYVYGVVDQIAQSITRDCVVVVKSTVPIGVNDIVERKLKDAVADNYNVAVVSNPEFLAQGTAVRDTLYASRIVVGADNDWAANIMEQVYQPLTKEPYNVPYVSMGRRSAEMVKYASNDFLALKISYINEISNLCEELGADISEVTEGMSHDSRIGSKFLNSGVGYGGSCFPKDTKALHWLSKQKDQELLTIKATIEVNKRQKIRLFNKLQSDIDNLSGKKIAVLGATFKPGTDDLRDAPSIDNIELLLEYGADVAVYDPVGLDHLELLFGDKIQYCSEIDTAIRDASAVLIMTEWSEIKQYDLNKYVSLMKTALVYDGRNCYETEVAADIDGLRYTSMGRPSTGDISDE